MNMKKKLLYMILLSVCMAFVYTGCGNSNKHQHDWTEITCAEPRTCKKCGATEGEPSKRHKWIEANCTEPRTCSVCGLTEGEALGHQEGDWCEEIPATLSNPGEKTKRCVYCDEKLDSEIMEKNIAVVNGGFNFDTDEIIDYLQKGSFCDLSNKKSYETKDVVLDTFAVSENSAGIKEVDVITKDDSLISVLITMESDNPENYKSVLSYLAEKLPKGKAKEIDEDFCENAEIHSFSKDTSLSLSSCLDDIFHICLSCGEANLTNSVNTADAILRIPLYIDIEFQSNLFLDKYGVTVSLNEEEICSLEHGEDCTKLLSVPYGSYTLSFTGTGDDPVKEKKTFDVTGPTTINCEIQTHSEEIEFHEFELIDNVDKASIEAPDVTGKLVSDARKILKDCGFVNINTDIEEWLFDGNEYRVIDQSIKAGEKYEYKEEILLNCQKISEEDATLIGRNPEEEAVSSSNADSTAVIASEFEKAFVMKGPNYSIYYMFDEDTHTVINFYTEDTSVMKGTYSGTFEEGVTIDWSEYGYTESLIEYADGTATLIDGNGWDVEYKSCDVSQAEKALKTING